MEKWDKGIQMLQEPAPVDQELLDKLTLIDDYHRHRAGVNTLLTSMPLCPRRPVKALTLVKDPITGAYGLPKDQEPTE